MNDPGLEAEFLDGPRGQSVDSLRMRSVDRSEKLPVYARHGVAHVWLLNPSTKSLEVLRLDGPTFGLVGTCVGDETVHVEPFEVLGLALRRLWRT
jgi:hypothetical protein